MEIIAAQITENRYTENWKSIIEKLFQILNYDRLKPLFTFGTEKKIKVHRFTNNLQGLQKVMVKDFSWNIIPWNAFSFLRKH